MKKSLFTLVLLLTAISQVSWGMEIESFSFKFKLPEITNKTGKTLMMYVSPTTKKEAAEKAKKMEAGHFGTMITLENNVTSSPILNFTPRQISFFLWDKFNNQLTLEGKELENFLRNKSYSIFYSEKSGFSLSRNN